MSDRTRRALVASALLATACQSILGIEQKSPPSSDASPEDAVSPLPDAGPRFEDAPVAPDARLSPVDARMLE